jgi:hypothetical protein
MYIGGIVDVTFLVFNSAQQIMYITMFVLNRRSVEDRSAEMFNSD